MRLRKKKDRNEKFILKEIKAGGIKWRYFENPLAAPYKRVLAYFMAIHETQLGIQRKDLEAFVTLQEKAFNAGDFSNANFYLGHLKSYLSLYAVEDNILKIGNSFILYPGESLTDMEPHFMQLKTELVKENEEVRAFFLSASFKQVERWRQSEIDFDVLGFLNTETARAAMTFLQLVRTNTSNTSPQH